ncbi:hypothetical protein BT69DRAFT_1318706 [Atractiella rhizophila]|nr:hypothetical protein BT69DRAFT_1318706 [Atractiella rhizophila]
MESMNIKPRNFHFFAELDTPGSDEFYLTKAKGLTLESSVLFTPGTYKLVLNPNGSEILPSSDSNYKLWLQSQSCPSPCSWRFQGKDYNENSFQARLGLQSKASKRSFEEVVRVVASKKGAVKRYLMAILSCSLLPSQE